MSLLNVDAEWRGWGLIFQAAQALNLGKIKKKLLAPVSLVPLKMQQTGKQQQANKLNFLATSGTLYVGI